MGTVTRDVRLTVDQLYHGREAVSRRIRELERRLRTTTYETKPGMLKSVEWELDTLKQLREIFDHNHKAAAKEFGRRMLSQR